MTPPLAVDIDGTLTDENRRLDPRVIPVLREWDAPVVLATGKALPYPVALSEFLGIPRTVVAENGGVAFVDRRDRSSSATGDSTAESTGGSGAGANESNDGSDDLLVLGDREAAQAVADEYVAAGYDLGWGPHDLVNRWRETEVAVNRDSPLEPLEHIAAGYDLEVVDTGFAYHVKSSTVTKGEALDAVADRLDAAAADFVAVGDSVNDVSTFRVAGRSFAVGNADARAREAADEVVDGRYGEGFLEAVDRLQSGRA